MAQISRVDYFMLYAITAICALIKAHIFSSRKIIAFKYDNFCVFFALGCVI